VKRIGYRPLRDLQRRGRATVTAQQLPGGGVADAADAISTAAVREQRLSSLSIAIAHGSRVLLAKAYGFADLEHEVPATERTVYRIGSITKQFTAAAILRLAVQRKLSLDDEASRYVPSLKRSGHSVSIRHALRAGAWRRDARRVAGEAEQVIGDLA
jgi:CubicO group peptidase (beta-lactamase class C family)